jgi:hypothetical protein
MNDINMMEVSTGEMEQVEGGGNWFGALLIVDGTAMTCMFGGGLALGPWGIAGCAVAGAAAGVVALAS